MKFPKMKRNQIRSRIAAKGGSYSLAVTAIVLANCGQYSRICPSDFRDEI